MIYAALRNILISRMFWYLLYEKSNPLSNFYTLNTPLLDSHPEYNLMRDIFASYTKY